MKMKRETLVLFFVMLASLAAHAKDANLPEVAKSGDGSVLSAALIYDLAGAPTPECHASTIVETKSGLVAAWFGGAHEKNPDVGIWLSRHVDGKWTKPVELVDGSENEDQEYACWNPVLFQPANGPLMLFYKVGLNPRDWWGALITSNDDGKTWSKSRRLGTDKALPQANRNLLGPVKNKPIQMADGKILCPTSTENEGWKVHFEVTPDLGKTWEVIGPLEGDFNAIQPSILTYPDGQLQVLCRTKEGVVAQSWSKDNGKSWTPLSATSLPNPNSGTDAITLADGRQLLVYNHTQRKGSFPSGRNMINVAISEDGKTWKPVLTLEKEKGEFSYPAVIQSSDGKVHITYTWQRKSVKHVILDPKVIQ
ncbi:MAG: exo-alpha-sialidase [Pirellulaceae bacterium]|nr:exo-alpha-sialidase [Pirellulaceae bacterium]